MHNDTRNIGGEPIPAFVPVSSESLDVVKGRQGHKVQLCQTYRHITFSHLFHISGIIHYLPKSFTLPTCFISTLTKNTVQSR